MKKNILLIIFLFAINYGYSQNGKIWKQVDKEKLSLLEKARRNSFPNEFTLYELDFSAFKNSLITAPVRGVDNSISSVIIEFPLSNGRFQKFRVIETPIMEEGLALKFPNIKSYAAQGIDDPTAVARFSVTEFGLHNMILSGGKSTEFLDPYTTGIDYYIAYNKASLEGTLNDFECLTDEGVNFPSLESDRKVNLNQFRDTDDKQLRTYRLAQSCTAEYGNLFRGNTLDPIVTQKGRIQAQMAITMTRVNGVYENDLGITMIFVSNNDQIIYLGATNSDPWNGEFNVQTGITIDANIGFSNYDIGHNFNTSGGGNAGCIGCVCGPDTNPNGNHKGTGMTGRSNPTGDPFDIDYVAHEMGHQFGGFHTQSSSGCRSGSGLTEVEPGSASTIMGYAGICNTNVQSNSDAYFAYVNIRDILLNVKSGISSSCPQITNLSNNPPVVDAGLDYIIPRSTAFILTATGSDPDGDALTYSWEQNDPENPNTTAAPTATRSVGPMFRSLTGTPSPVRYMPNLSTVLAGGTSNTWEVCPSVGRDLNFSVVARDNRAGGGQTSSDLMKVTVSDASGPFVLTTPNTAVTWQAGTNQTVAWNVANSDLAPVNAKFVDIYLSTNGGSSFPILLASKVPNDGSEIVTVPNIPGSQNRIMVRGYNNIFYDLSNSNFTISAPSSTFLASFSGVAEQQNKSVCQGSSVVFDINYETLSGFTGTTNFSATGQPAGTTLTFTPASATTTGTVVMQINTTGSTIAGFYSIIVTATSGGTSKTIPFYLDVTNGNFGTQTLTSPLDNSVAQLTTLDLSWPSNAAATSYDIQVATDSGFTSIIFSGEVTTNSYSLSGLSDATIYYWRVKPKNEGCEGVYSSEYNFQTGQTSCDTTPSVDVPVNIISTTPNTINSTLNIPSGEVITDLNVNINISHTWIQDLTVTLIGPSPSNTEVILLLEPCGNDDDINATIDDSGAIVSCSGGVPALSGTFVPSESLAVFNGQNSTGTWTLRIEDGFNGDGGSLNSWSLNICSVQPLSTEGFEIENLMIYPNPNNGSFNVQLNSTSGNDIKIGVYDVRGRLVFDKSYQNSGLFNQSLNLNNVQSGIYFVTVQDGSKKTTKKIVVE